jgi:apolipoprotein N-acyltransferase
MPAAVRSDWLLLLLAFALLCVANGRWQMPAAAWLAPLVLLIFIESRPLRSGLGLACLVQLLAFSVNWRGMIPVPGLWYYLVASIYAIAYFAPFVLHRVIAPHWNGFRSTLVFPVSWVAVEIVFQKLVTPYGSWAAPAYTQVGFLPLIQVASVTGLSGIHFLMMWLAAVGSWAWKRGGSFAMVRTGVVTCGTVFSLVLIWGQWRILSAPTDPPELRVAMLTPSAKLNRELQAGLGSLTNPPSSAASVEALSVIAGRINDDLLERTQREAAAGAEVIVWSEHAARVTRRTEPELIERARTLADSAGVPLILGLGLWDPDSRPSFENKVAMIDARGALSGVYHKARPIVGQESGLIPKGDASIGAMMTDHGRFGIVICHDLDFPDLMRQAGRMGVVVLFGPSSDWEAITPLHGHMAILRAVENGSSLIRPTSNGLSLVVDPYGRVAASQVDRGEKGNVLTANVPLFRLRTAYPVLGDTFAYVNVLVLALLVAGRCRSALRRSGAAKGARQ